MQIDLLPDLPLSGGYENIVTATDVFSCYFFAYRRFNQDVKTIAKVENNYMTKQALLPMALISDKGSAFVFQIFKEVAAVLGLILKHATTKRAQTIRMPERSHVSIKQTLKNETGDRR